MRTIIAIAGVGVLSLVAVIAWASGEGESRQVAAVPKIPAQLPDSVQITRVPDVATLRSPGDHECFIDCLVRCDPPSQPGDRQAGVTVITEIPCPRFKIRDGERVTVSDTSVERRMVAEISESGTTTPVVREFTAGTSFTATVVDLGGEEVLLDLAARWSGNSSVPQEDPTSIKITANEGRIIQRVKSGEKLTAGFDGWSLEATVLKIDGDVLAP
ncbi:MAG TPA: hypothetical protein VGN12_08165 [Pirellulales bacterium]